jgi:pimeloyl-ACP methyl ester carboxylesterase
VAIIKSIGSEGFGMSARRSKTLYRLRRFQRGLISSLARRWRIFSPLLRAQVPVRLKHYASASPSEELLIFLPGLGDVLEDYEFRGFIDAARRSSAPFDMTVADMHFGYYVTRTALERLREDIILPARVNGYSRISLAGISLGGFGALYYAMHYPDDISRLFLLAPYLGAKQLIGEISQAGGAKEWAPDNAAEHDETRKLWQWLKCAGTEARQLRLAQFYLVYGLQDTFAAANKLLADLLPAGHVYTVQGKHDWRTWKSLWNLLLGDSQIIFSSTERGTKFNYPRERTP